MSEEETKDKELEVEILDENTGEVLDGVVSECVEDNALEEAQTQIEQLKAELEKEKNDYLFLRADFDNYRKRMLREREELIKNAGEKVLGDVLPIVDDFERGLAATAQAKDVDAVREGMELIYNKLLKFLSAHNVTPIESTEKPFDADLFEAIAMLPVEDKNLKGKVVDTTQRGYKINEKVLRHAKVVVGE